MGVQHSARPDRDVAGRTGSAFGTGCSSLSYLSRLLVNVINIDRSFVDGLDRTRADGAGHATSIVRTMLALADTLSLDVVAEGIEHTEQADVLNKLGCRYGQGFLWSPSSHPAQHCNGCTPRPPPLRRPFS
jgi:EAL domain-containing protein (putative c-di-GMP-specific phosphodiesterase class I)